MHQATACRANTHGIRSLPFALRRSAAGLLVALLAVIGGPVTSARADTLIVTNTEDSGPGSLRDALFDAFLSGATNTIQFQFDTNAHYQLNLTGGALSIMSNLTIEGPAAGLTINAQDASAAFLVTGGTVIIKNVSMVNGSESAVLNLADLWLENVTISNSHGDRGGGIVNLRKLRLVSSTVNGNSANSQGGGIFNADGAEATLGNVTISDNEAPVGGAIFNAGALTAYNASVVDNRANQASGIMNTTGTMTLLNTLMAGNDANGNCVGNVATLNSANNFQDAGLLCGPSFRARQDLRSLLSPLQDNGGPTATHALLPGSPAVNGGNIDDCLGVDQRGRDRPATAQDPCDVGAYELEPTAATAPQSPSAPAIQAAPLAESPFAQRPPLQPVYVVTSLEDVSAADISSTQCVSTIGACTLRAAVQAANLRGVGTIQLSQAGTYALTISSRGLGDQGGDLDITGLVHIQNTSRGQVTIKQTVNRSVFSVRADGHLYLSDVEVSGGDTLDGGGLSIDFGGTAVVEGVTFSHNHASERGGGIYANGALRLFNSTISDNAAGVSGGGVYSDQAGDIVIQSSTITNNTAPTGAGADFAGSNNAWQIDNTIIANQNGGGNCRAPIAKTGSGGNLQSGAAADCGTGFTVGDAKLAALTNNGGPTPTHALGEGSAAIGKARADVCISRSGSDQRWMKRPNACDIGAYESAK